jgi:hypothetical protein
MFILQGCLFLELVLLLLYGKGFLEVLRIVFVLIVIIWVIAVDDDTTVVVADDVGILGLVW